MLAWIKANLIPVSLIVLVLASAALLGCSSWANPPIEVPPEMVEANDGKKTVDIDAAEDLVERFENEIARTVTVKKGELEEYIETSEIALREFGARAERAATWRDQVRGILWGGIDLILNEGSKAIPGSQLFLPALTGFIGLFIRRPGDASKIQEATKRASTAEVRLSAAEVRLAALNSKVDEEWEHGYKIGLAAAGQKGNVA
jgi:hypothetical protein